MTDLSIVPLAAPLIAASIAASAEGGLGSTVPALCIAIPVNYLLMFFAQPVNMELKSGVLPGIRAAFKKIFSRSAEKSLDKKKNRCYIVSRCSSVGAALPAAAMNPVQIRDYRVTVSGTVPQVRACRTAIRVVFA